MSRLATKMDILAAIDRLDALPKPRGVAPRTVIPSYEIALDGVQIEDLERAVEHVLRHKDFFPSPSELYGEIIRLQPSSKAQQSQEDEVLTPGQKLGFPLLKDDPAGRERANALWAKVRPTLKGLKSFDDASRDMAELKRQHEGAALDKAIAEAKKRDQERQPPEPMTEAERLERIKQRGHEPTQPTEALLRALRNPMHPAKEGE